MALEVFCGSGRLTASIKREGFDAFGVDHNVLKTASCSVLQLDLTQEDATSHLWSIVRDPAVQFIHFAPPCGTASRARDIQFKGAPPILRSTKQPHGVDGLEGLDFRLANIFPVRTHQEVTCGFCPPGKPSWRGRMFSKPGSITVSMGACVARRRYLFITFRPSKSFRDSVAATTFIWAGAKLGRLGLPLMRRPTLGASARPWPVFLKTTSLPLGFLPRPQTFLVPSIKCRLLEPSLACNLASACLRCSVSLLRCTPLLSLLRLPIHSFGRATSCRLTGGRALRPAADRPLLCSLQVVVSCVHMCCPRGGESALRPLTRLCSPPLP